MQRKRGSVLILALFMMFLLELMAIAFVTFIPVESQAARRSEHQTVGSLVADAGVTEALAWLRFQIAPPDGSASKEPLHPTVYPSEAGRTRDVGGGWTYRWRLEPDSETYPNPANNPIRGYTITSRAYKFGRVQREARAQVIQESLSRYAALYDHWPNNLVMGIDTTDVPAGGPVHLNNDIMRLWIKDGASFWSSPGQPIFDHGLTAVGKFNHSSGYAGDGFAYYQGNYSSNSASNASYVNNDKIPYNSGGPVVSRYNRLAGSPDNMKSGASEVPLPKNTFKLRDAAWGFETTNPLPTSAGVYVNAAADKSVEGGIYIKGDVQEMQLGYGGTQPAGPGTVNYGENSWVKVELPIANQNKIDSNKNVTVVTVETAITLPAGTVLDGATLGGPVTINGGNTLIRRADGKFESYTGSLNGVVYANGDINDVWGVNKGRRTIAVESDADASVEHDIVIGGKKDDTTGVLSLAAGQKGLLQFGAADGDSDGVLDPPTTADNVLGLIGHNVQISSGLKQNSSWTTSHPETNPLYLYALVLAGEPGNGGTYSVQSYNSGGAGYVYRYGSRIVVDAGAWGTTSGHGLINGNTFFDEPAASSPPPYFPSVPTFTVKSYQDLVTSDGETI